jgi:hypothetical protein
LAGGSVTGGSVHWSPGGPAARTQCWRSARAEELGSWINLVERLFAEITRQQIRRGVFKSVAELEAAVDLTRERNAKPKPFKWTAKAHNRPGEKCAAQASGGTSCLGGYQMNESEH